MRDALALAFPRYRGHVFVMAIGAVVRMIAPLLESKWRDPAVVCVDEAGRFAVSVLSGHAGGANRLAEEVAAVLGAQAVVTTASDVLPRNLVLGIGCDRGAPPDLVARGVETLLTRHRLALASVRVIATIDLKADEPALRALAERLACPLRLFGAAELDAAPGVESFSETVRRHVGTRAVAEPAALLASGAGHLLVPRQIYTEPGAGRSMTLAAARLPIQNALASALLPRPALRGEGDGTLSTPAAFSPERSAPGDAHSTLSLPRERRCDVGTLAVVGIGPGAPAQMTAAAREAIGSAEVVVGYATYLQLLGPLLAGKEVLAGRMTAEIARAREAVERARRGARVALVSSGDAGIYGMAALALEVLREMGWRRGESPDVTVLPGVTAMSAAASLAGAPLGHDFCAVSLSDLLTPWTVIARRLEAAAAADFVIALYNPASTLRRRPLAEARAVLLRHRPATTPVTVVTGAYRAAARCVLTDLDRLLDEEIGMTTTVLVGSTRSYAFEGFLVTPRGYGDKYDLGGTARAGERPWASIASGEKGRT
jgi:precorrin-3B C17-methyltransferase